MDASDADFVDVIHTNGASAGLLNAAAGIFRPVGLVGKMSLFKKKQLSFESLMIFVQPRRFLCKWLAYFK